MEGRRLHQAALPQGKSASIYWFNQLRMFIAIVRDMCSLGDAERSCPPFPPVGRPSLLGVRMPRHAFLSPLAANSLVPMDKWCLGGFMSHNAWALD